MNGRRNRMQRHGRSPCVRDDRPRERITSLSACSGPRLEEFTGLRSGPLELSSFVATPDETAVAAANLAFYRALEARDLA